jgi:oligopeptide/dipeptide ABC transporter ATP-binding protein
VLKVENLSVVYHRDGRSFAGIDKVSFDLRPGTKLAIVGESGSGKSTTARALCGMLQPPTDVSGSVLFDNIELLNLSPRRRSELMGRAITFVPQEARASLNPRLTIGTQLVEVAQRHLHLRHNQARETALAGLADVRIPDPNQILNSYPHQLSGGMCQRVVIAMGLMCGPRLVVADEPTASLDATLALKIMTLLNDATDRVGCSVVLITHNLLQAADFADTILVMYGGEVVEMAPAGTLVDAPRMPYTRALLDCVPRIGEARSIKPIPGQYVQDPARVGCCFAPRCESAQPVCRSVEPALSVIGSRTWKCHYPIELDR